MAGLCQSRRLSQRRGGVLRARARGARCDRTRREKRQPQALLVLVPLARKRRRKSGNKFGVPSGGETSDGQVKPTHADTCGPVLPPQRTAAAGSAASAQMQPSSSSSGGRRAGTAQQQHSTAAAAFTKSLTRLIWPTTSTTNVEQTNCLVGCVSPQSTAITTLGVQPLLGCLVRTRLIRTWPPTRSQLGQPLSASVPPARCCRCCRPPAPRPLRPPSRSH